MESGAGKKQLKDTFIFVTPPPHISLSLCILIPSACFPWVIKIKRACLDERRTSRLESGSAEEHGQHAECLGPTVTGREGKEALAGSPGFLEFFLKIWGTMLYSYKHLH